MALLFVSAYEHRYRSNVLHDTDFPEEMALSICLKYLENTRHNTVFVLKCV